MQAFSTSLTLAGLFASAGLAMNLAPDAAWLRQYSWLVPVTWGLALFFFLCAVVSTRWFQSWARELLGIRKSDNEAATFGPSPRSSGGDYSENYAAGRDINVHPPERPKPSITIADRRGLLEAVAPRHLVVDQTGYVMAAVSHGITTLSETQQYRTRLGTWDEIKSEACSLPFRFREGQALPTTLRLQLLFDDHRIRCPKTVIDLDLDLGTAFRDFLFMVTASMPGKYAAQVIALVQKKCIATVHLEGEAQPEEAEDFQSISRVNITIDVGPAMKMEKSISHEKEYKKDLGKGYGMSI